MATMAAKINDLICWTRKNNHVARAACFLEQFFSCRVPNDSMKFSFLSFSQQCEPAEVSISFLAFVTTIHAKQAKVHFTYCTTWPTWNNHTTVKPMQSSTLMWHFCCSSLLKLPKMSLKTQNHLTQTIPGLCNITQLSLLLPAVLPLTLQNSISSREEILVCLRVNSSAMLLELKFGIDVDDKGQISTVKRYRSCCLEP